MAPDEPPQRLYEQAGICIDLARSPGLVHLYLTGRVDVTTREVIVAAVARVFDPRRPLEIDLSGVTEFDGHGWSTLMGLRVAASLEGGRIWFKAATMDPLWKGGPPGSANAESGAERPP